MSETTQAPFILRDGLTLAIYDWPLPEGVRPRGVVLLVHGLGEHAWRYNALASRLNTWGFWVRSYDQRGHGVSAGRRGLVQQDDELVDDLDEVIEDTRALWSGPMNCPLFLMGHSMGGLVAATWAMRRPKGVQGLVLSSPALAIPAGAWKGWLIDALSRYAPNTAWPNGLDPDRLSHDLDTVAAYRQDPSIHDRVSPKLARFLRDGGVRLLAHAPAWQVPTLVLYAGQDHMVDARATARFVALAPRHKVQAMCLAHAYHEIFNEPQEREVLDARLRAWLCAESLKGDLRVQGAETRESTRATRPAATNPG